MDTKGLVDTREIVDMANGMDIVDAMLDREIEEKELRGFRCQRPALHLVHILARGFISAGRKNNGGLPDVFRVSLPAKRIPHFQSRTEFNSVIVK